MSTRELLKKRRRDVLRIAHECGASNIRLFGSVAHGEEGPESDIDFLVTMEHGRSLLDLIHLELELTELLERRAQVVSDGGLNQHFRDYILKDAAPL